MKTKSVFFPAIIFAALSLTVPASAQQRRGDEQGDRGGERARPRQEAPRGNGQQRQAQPRKEAPRENRAPQQQAQPRADSARGVYARPRDDERGYRGRENERPRVAPYRPYHYAQPYYAFRPHLNLGFGLWLGYPVPYPYYGYVYPYGPADTYPYGADGYPPPPPPDSVDVAPGQAYGGLSFEITPTNAGVYIDGQYAGVVSDFTPNAQPLTVLPGQHRIDIEAPGYRPMVFDVYVDAGQVMPYSGTLQPY